MYNRYQGRGHEFHNYNNIRINLKNILAILTHGAISIADTVIPMNNV